MSTSTLSPRHKHTCRACEFLGTSDEYDLYFCRNYQQSIIRGPLGEVAKGKNPLVDVLHALAKRRAVKAGLVPVEALK